MDAAAGFFVLGANNPSSPFLPRIGVRLEWGGGPHYPEINCTVFGFRFSVFG